MLDFLKFKKGVDELGHSIREMHAEIEAKKQRREFLEAAPLPRAELADSLCAMVERRAEEYPTRLARAIEGLKHKPFYDFSNSRLDIIGTFGGGSQESVIPKPNFAWLLGDHLKDRIRAAVDVMPWPDEDAGPPLAERTNEIEQLDREIADLEAKLEKMVQQAESAGIHVTRLLPPKH